MPSSTKTSQRVSHFYNPIVIASIIIFLFFSMYTLLGVIKHLHFLSGYDLAVIDQAIWKYSQFKAPISTNHAYPFTSILTDHLEFIFILIAPFYWIFNDPITLIVLQTAIVASSGMAVFLFARKKGLRDTVSLSILVSYFMFYGIQHALWSDVHSLLFGISFLAWFLYFIETHNNKFASVFFVLAISSKEDIALLTFVISAVYFFVQRRKILIFFSLLSILYLLFVFFVYFPYFVPGGYRFQSEKGLLSNINLATLSNTQEKRDVWLYSFAWFGLLPLASPLYVLPAIADLLKYFVVANTVVTSGQGMFGHYRSTLAILLVWPTIITIAKYKKLNSTFIALYIVLFAFFFQYILHLPLSYVTKRWFWTPYPAVTTLHEMVKDIPKNVSLVTTVQIAPHVAHRDEAFILWPTTISQKENEVCKEQKCDWARWPGNPHYLLVDVSKEWDARHLLTNNAEFQRLIQNLEAGGIIKKEKQRETTILYKILKKP